MIKSTSAVFLFFLLISVSAQIEINIPTTDSGIPFSLQSLIIFIVSAFLSPRITFIGVLLYLLAGIVGLPVFAGGASGLNHILGNSGGFLIGFIVSALFISFHFKNNKGENLVSVFNVILQATMVLFFFGIVHLAIKYGVQLAFEYGFFSFWKMALLKAILASLIIWLIKRSRPALKFKS